MYKNLIFDCDGTTLETLPDIKDALNDALKSLGYVKQYTYEESKKLISKGMREFLIGALNDVKPNFNDKDLEDLTNAYFPLYHDYQKRTTGPFPNTIDVLSFLKEKGFKLFVLSNKPHQLLEIVVEEHFKGLFEDIQGQILGGPAKPDKEFFSGLIERNKIDLKESLYIGDSIIDVQTAENLGCDLCLCLFGYGNYNEIDMSKCKYVIKSMLELKEIFE